MKPVERLYSYGRTTWCYAASFVLTECWLGVDYVSDNLVPPWAYYLLPREELFVLFRRLDEYEEPEDTWERVFLSASGSYWPLPPHLHVYDGEVTGRRVVSNE